jgi:hypothetical protein
MLVSVQETIVTILPQRAKGGAQECQTRETRGGKQDVKGRTTGKSDLGSHPTDF